MHSIYIYIYSFSQEYIVCDFNDMIDYMGI